MTKQELERRADRLADALNSILNTWEVSRDIRPTIGEAQAALDEYREAKAKQYREGLWWWIIAIL